MISVQEAEDIILSQVKDYGSELVPFEEPLGRTLAEDIACDRDMPAYDRITMDGIAVSYAALKQGITSFKINTTQAAGDEPIDITTIDECIEIMTGAALPRTTDTVIPYEQINIENGIATLITAAYKKGQNIHYTGKDRRQGDSVLTANTIIDAAAINVAATVGKAMLLVKKLPRILIVSTGDELVEVDQIPNAYQVRRSNNYTIKAVLQQHALSSDMLHLPDNAPVIEAQLIVALNQYDVLILSGGISMGKYDHLPKALETVGVKKLFHKVRQRPGKPFWFGVHSNGATVFAFPGNPVSAFMCLHRYFLPWYKQSMGLGEGPKTYAVLSEDVTFTPALQYYMQVKLSVNEQAQIIATPIQGNGSGDLANLLDSNAFLELPEAVSEFKKGEVFRVFMYKQIFG